MRYFRSVLLLAITCTVMHCREPYDPALETGITNYLVVEGLINTTGKTSIRLSRTLKLNDKATTSKPELKATVQIESDNNTVMAVGEVSNGLYTTNALSLPADRKYRLRIKTTAGGEYLSEYTTPKKTPPLDVSWERVSDGLIRPSTTR